MKELISLFKSLSDETRVRILHVLSEQDLCVCEMVEILELDQPKISKHIAKIKQTDLITSSKNQQFIYYSMNKESQLYPLLKEIINSFKSQVILEKDIHRLRSITSFVCERV